MKIGIVGPAERAHVWEKYLRPHQSVSQVILAAAVDKVGSVDACFLLDDTSDRIQHLLQAVKAGHHIFFISRLPTEKKTAEKIYHISQEANVRIQFSHWPTLAPASQWMHQQVKTPTFLRTNRNIRYANFASQNLLFRDLWIDELAYCLKFIDSPVHRLDVTTAPLPSGQTYAFHLLIRFDNRATAVIEICICARQHEHSRFVTDGARIINCSVKKQLVTLNTEKNGRLITRNKSFDASMAAESAVSQFLKSIQLQKPTLYNSYDLLQTADVIERVEARL